MLLKEYNSQLSNIVMCLLIPICLSFLSVFHGSGIIKGFSVALISFSMFQVLKTIAIILVGSIYWLFGVPKENIVVYMLAFIIAFAGCVLFSSVKRFDKGMCFFYDTQNLGLGVALSGIIFMMTCIELRGINYMDMVFVVIIIGVIIAGFGLYLWIRSSITAHYRERLQLKSEEHYKEMLEDRDKEIEKLSQSNEYLAKIVHRDNHLMNAVNTSVNAYFDSDKKEDKDHLLRDLQTLTKERADLINQEQLKSKLLPSTGNLLIDSAINDLYIKATSHSIDFNLTVSSTVDEIIGKYISQTDLQTLLCDHIKDAIIAVESRGEAGGKILVNLSMQKENYCIDIYDNGVDFDAETLSKLGMERVTTHADTGGSGIGFMTTFETLKKAYASLVITEFENKTPFSKSVTFRFDGENAFIIRSYRCEELKKNISRNDLIIDGTALYYTDVCYLYQTKKPGI